MNWLVWSLTITAMLVGVVGTIVPLLPGTTIILAAAIIHHVVLGEAQSVGWWTIAALTVLTLLSYALDLLSGSVGAKYFGATRWGAFGGIVGTIIGMFFFPWGLFLGPVIGVLLGELVGGKELVPAGKSSWGTFLGTTVGMICKVTIAGIMVVWFLIAALWR